MAKNNWYVLTGAPCSGKTTLIKMLEQKGFQVVNELARLYIDQEIAKGKTLEQLRENELLFQQKILELKIETEKNLSPEKIIFFDRGIPDSLAYYQLVGIGQDDFLDSAVLACDYKKVFLLDFVEYKKDYARIESAEEQRRLHELLAESYWKLNIPLINVPTVPKSEIIKRLDIILNNL